jgi:uncharacterized protein (TIGR03083 family)
MPDSTTTPDDRYLAAAGVFADLVERIPAEKWDRPGLGVWDVRSLVGHASRALITVLRYLDEPAAAEDVATPQEYFVRSAGHGVDATAVAERGRKAGVELGADPAGRVRELLAQVSHKVRAAEPDALITTIGGGMRVAAYLPTRTFELVVHSLDIAAAVGLDVTFPPEVLADVAQTAALAAVESGQGAAVLLALTGRRALPDGFSVTP